MITFWHGFGLVTALKIILMPTPPSTDFEVHRNWLAITHSLPIKRWYADETSVWTLDYPPFFAYMEWLLSQVARFIDPQMLVVTNLNYMSERTLLFQRLSVIATDVFYAWGILRCLDAMKVPKGSCERMTLELILLWNIGLLIIDHMHFQYNGFLFGVLLLSISYMLERRYLLATFTFATLLNFKHIFLYMAPAFAAYLFRFHCYELGKIHVNRIIQLGIVGLTPFVLSFMPFCTQLPQVLTRLFPFKRGLTHAYWAPNFWALYNVADTAAEILLGVPRRGKAYTTGRVQEYEHSVCPSIYPKVTIVLTCLFMIPCIMKLFYSEEKSNSGKVFVRSIVICSCASFLFGWHVHEKAILMTLIPLSLLSTANAMEAKCLYILSVVGVFSLLPLLFLVDLLVIRYCLLLLHSCALYAQMRRIFNNRISFEWYERLYLFGFAAIPLFEHVLSPMMGWDTRYPFMPLLLTSFYCSLGVVYFFANYYCYFLWPVLFESRAIYSAKLHVTGVRESKIKRK